jgi:hypothetical protein
MVLAVDGKFHGDLAGSIDVDFLACSLDHTRPGDDRHSDGDSGDFEEFAPGDAGALRTSLGVF